LRESLNNYSTVVKKTMKFNEYNNIIVSEMILRSIKAYVELRLQKLTKNVLTGGIDDCRKEIFEIYKSIQNPNGDFWSCPEKGIKNVILFKFGKESLSAQELLKDFSLLNFTTLDKIIQLFPIYTNISIGVTYNEVQINPLLKGFEIFLYENEFLQFYNQFSDSTDQETIQFHIFKNYIEKIQYIDQWDIIKKLLYLTSKIIDILTLEQSIKLLIVVANKSEKVERHLIKNDLILDFIMTKMFNNRSIISDIVCQLFALYLSEKELQSIDLRYCKNITDKGIRKLQHFTSLETIDISYTNITDKSLEQLTKNKNLKYILLSGCNNITDDGVLSISKLEPTLLNLCGCLKVSNEVLEKYNKIFY